MLSVQTNGKGTLVAIEKTGFYERLLFEIVIVMVKD